MTFRPFDVIPGPADAPWIVTCDHASNHVPQAVGDLGLPAADMERHIAYDVGAAGVTRALADALRSPAVLCNVSRLVIDPNRGEDDLTLIMRLYDGSIIPGNRHVDGAERARRINAYHRPYHTALAGLVRDHGQAALMAMHSFTPQLAGRPPRPWHVGVLFAGHNPLAEAFIAELQGEADLCVGINEPYSGHLPGDAMDQHALQTGRAHVLLEIRNDLIETEAQQIAWAKRLAPIATRALARTQETPDG